MSENVFYISCSTCVTHQVEPLNFKHRSWTNSSSVLINRKHCGSLASKMPPWESLLWCLKLIISWEVCFKICIRDSFNFLCFCWNVSRNVQLHWCCWRKPSVETMSVSYLFSVATFSPVSCGAASFCLQPKYRNHIVRHCNTTLQSASPLPPQRSNCRY